MRLYIWRRTELTDEVRSDAIPDAAGGEGGHGAAKPGLCECGRKRRLRGAVFSVVPTPRSGRLQGAAPGPPSLRAPGRITLNCRASSPVLKTAPHLSFCS